MECVDILVKCNELLTQLIAQFILIRLTRSLLSIALTHRQGIWLVKSLIHPLGD